jgi:hypothetical protein
MHGIESSGGLEHDNDKPPALEVFTDKREYVNETLHGEVLKQDSPFRRLSGSIPMDTHDESKEEHLELEEDDDDNVNDEFDQQFLADSLMSDSLKPASPNQLPSPYMSRQASKAHSTGLSPIEEIKLAQGELEAKAALKMVCIH